VTKGTNRNTPQGPQARRGLLAAALALSLGAHLGVAAALWVEQPAQPEAGAVVGVEIVPEAGAAQSLRASANSAAAGASAETAKPAAAPDTKIVPPPVPPRAAGEPPGHSPPTAEAPAGPAPQAVEEKASALTAPRPPARVPPAPAYSPRLAAPPAATSPAARMRLPLRTQTASIPIGAADAAPGAAAPGAGPEAGASPPRYGLGSAANPIPRYPEIARARGWEGVVLLNVSVAADGRAETVDIARSSGHAVLDEAALDAVRRWRFDPARRAGVRVPGAATVPIRFKLED